MYRLTIIQLLFNWITLYIFESIDEPEAKSKSKVQGQFK